MRLDERLRPAKPLSAERREQLAALWCAIARPVYGDEHLAQIRTAAEPFHSQPMQVAGLQEDLTLWLWHGLTRAGIPWGQVSAATCPAEMERKAALRESFVRMELRNRLAVALESSGIPGVWLKGAALLDRYEAPWVRPMCDLDLAVSAAQEFEVLELLKREGWARRHPQGATYLHADGALLDLHVPHGDFGSRIMSNAMSVDGGLRIPRAADHVVLLAMHLFRSQGEPLWKTLADADACGVQDGGELDDAMKAAPDDAAEAIRAFIAVWRDRSLLWSKAEAAPSMHLLRCMAAEPNGAAALHLARQALSPRVMRKGSRSSTAFVISAPAPMLAAVPRRDRIAGALWLLTNGWRDPAARALLQTARLQRKTALLVNPFRAPLSACV